MYRTFTLPVPSSYASIWTMLQTAGFIDSLGNMLVSSAKNDAIIPDRVHQLDVRPSDATTGSITYRDAQADPGTEQVLQGFEKNSNRNSICLKDYLFQQGSAEDAIVVEIEST